MPGTGPHAAAAGCGARARLRPSWSSGWRARRSCWRCWGSALASTSPRRQRMLPWPRPPSTSPSTLRILPSTATRRCAPLPAALQPAHGGFTGGLSTGCSWVFAPAVQSHVVGAVVARPDGHPAAHPLPCHNKSLQRALRCLCCLWAAVLRGLLEARLHRRLPPGVKPCVGATRAWRPHRDALDGAQEAGEEGRGRRWDQRPGCACGGQQAARCRAVLKAGPAALRDASRPWLTAAPRLQSVAAPPAVHPPAGRLGLHQSS